MSNTFRALYTWPGTYNDLDWEQAESDGLTDIILSDSNLLSDYSTLLAHIDAYLSVIGNTDLNLHIMSPPFRDANGDIVDPANTTHRNNMAYACANTLTDRPEIAGIHFDDYFYPKTYYIRENDAAQEQALVEFLDSVGDAIHDIDTSSKLSAAIFASKYNSSSPITLAPHMDYVTAQIYRLYQSNTLFWLNTQINNLKSYIGSKPAVIGLITFTTGYVTRTIEQIEEDINLVLSKNVEGYALFNYDYSIKTGLTWPSQLESPEPTPTENTQYERNNKYSNGSLKPKSLNKKSILI